MILAKSGCLFTAYCKGERTVNIIISRVHYYMEKLADLFLLNLLWVLSCLPIITIFPATVSMYGVVRKWIMKKETDGIFRTFFHQFRECFRQSLGVSILWAALAYFIYLDFQIINSNKFLLGILGLFTLLFLSFTMYLFPIMAHFQTNWKNIIRNSLIIAVFSPFSTIALLVILLVTLCLIYLFPIFISVAGSVSAYLSYRICHRLFIKIKAA